MADLTKQLKTPCPECHWPDGAPRITNLVGRCPKCHGVGKIEAAPSSKNETVQRFSAEGFITKEAIGHFVLAADYDSLTTRLTQAEAEVAHINAQWGDALKRVSALSAEGARLRAALKKIIDYDPGQFRPLEDEIAIWRLATKALGPVSDDSSADETTDHEADLANQLQAVDSAYRDALKQIDALKARIPNGDYILVSDTEETYHKGFGQGLFATHDSVHAVEPSVVETPENPLDDTGNPVCVKNPSLHSWSTRGRLGNPLPEQLCENGCGLMWKNRASESEPDDRLP